MLPLSCRFHPAQESMRIILSYEINQAAIAETDLPIAVHLDHGDSFELCKSCIDGGFTSVMIDGSSSFRRKYRSYQEGG